MNHSTERSYDSPGMPREEAEILQVRPTVLGTHPITALICWMIILGGAVGLVGSLMIGNTFLGMVCGLGILVAGLIIGYWTILYHFRVLTVTEKRTIYRQGIIAKRSSEVQHDDVRNIKSDQNVIQRLLQVGDIAISSSGQDEMEIVVRGIANPEHVLEIIRRYQ